MLRLNIRHQLPQTAQRIQHSRMEASMNPAELHTDYQAPRSNLGLEQSTIEIDTYPSRHSYGYENNTDFARHYGQDGLSDIRETTSRRTQQAWSLIDNGMKKGSKDAANFYHGQLSRRVSQQRHIVAQAIPDPEVHITPARLVGTPDPGHMQVSIDATSKANIRFQPAQVQTYVQNEGFIRQWTSIDRYDIYA